MTADIRIWYTVLVACAGLLTVSMNGARWVVLTTRNAARERAMRLAGVAWWGVLTSTIAVAVVSVRIEPQLIDRLTSAPWGFIFPVVALAGLFGVRASRTPQMEFLAFFFSCVYLAGIAGSALFGALPLTA